MAQTKQKQIIEAIALSLETHPKVQALANEYPYDFDRKNCPASSLILKSIDYILYPSKAFVSLTDKITSLDKTLGETIKNNGINYHAIGKGDTYCASGYKETETIGIDTEEWYSELKIDINHYQNNEKLWTQIQSALDEFETDLTSEIQNYLYTNGIEDKDLNHFIVAEDFTNLEAKYNVEQEGGANNLIWIYEEPESRRYNLLFQSDNEDIWDFIDINRGSLIWWEQIKDPELLADSINDDLDLIYSI